MQKIIDRVKPERLRVESLVVGEFFYTAGNDLCVVVGEASMGTVNCLCWGRDGEAAVKPIPSRELVQPVTVDFEVVAYTRDER